MLTNTDWVWRNPKDELPERARTTFRDWTFQKLFGGLVYNQVWEDPEVDLQALALGPVHRVVLIGSAGCNALAYLSANVKRIDAVDINSAHRALFALKQKALERLPSQSDFFRFFGIACSPENVADYDARLAAHLPDSQRAYWSGRGMLGQRRIEMFRSGFYKHGLLARFVGLIHKVAQLRGRNLERLVEASGLDEQARLYAREVAPLFRARLTRALARNPASLFALGIPPAQYGRMAEGTDGEFADLLASRIERMACAFPIAENPFAWQIFARRYGPMESKALPLYLKPQIHDVIQPRTDRLHLSGRPMTDYLAELPRGSVHRFVLLDAQDWMSADAQAALWREIGRTADLEDARVLFRTAGRANPFRTLPENLRRGWTLRDDLTPELTASDRTGLYDGVHLVERSVWR
jgi:S-adenosylmethionine-diacylglycerol 3-amino-3-carboxypropyl transferase